MPIGDVRKPIALDRMLVMPPALLTAPDSLDKAPPNLAKPCMAIPTFDITVPMIISIGARAAMKPPTIRIARRCPSLMLLSLSTKP